MTDLIAQVPVPPYESTRRTKLTPQERRQRESARSYAGSYMRRGKIDKRRCLICDGCKHLEFHHVDYSQPLAVISLCRKHHRMLTDGKLSLIPAAVKAQLIFDQAARAIQYKANIEAIARRILRTVKSVKV